MTKLLKKSLAVVLSVALCLSVMVCGFVASADGEPTITLVADNATPAAGDTVKIDVKVANFDAVAGAQFDVVLGELALVEGSITSTVDEEFVEAYINVLDGSIRLVNENVDDELVAITTANGVLFSFEVTVPADAVAEDAFTVEFANAKFCEATDGEPEVTVKAEAVTLTVPVPAPVGPQPDASIANVVDSTVRIDQKVEIIYTIELPAAYDDFTLEIERTALDGAYKFETIPVVYSTTQIDTAYPDYRWYQSNLRDIELYEMSLPIKAKLTLYKDGEAKVYHEYEEKSVADFVIDFFNAADSIADETKRNNTKSLAVDLLNLGAAAQNNFDAANNDLWGLELANADADQNYATTDYGVLNDVSGDNTAKFDAIAQITGAISLIYNTSDNAIKSYDPADVTFDVYFTSKAQKKEVGFTKLGSDSYIDSTWVADYGWYAFNFTDLALYDTDKVVTATITYKAGTDDEVVLLTNVYSVESFLAQKMSLATGDTKALLEAMARFGVSARNYWPNY